jgi:hypothetical protein
LLQDLQKEIALFQVDFRSEMSRHPLLVGAFPKPAFVEYPDPTNPYLAPPAFGDPMIAERR